MSCYPKKPYDCGNDSSVLQPGRTADKLVAVRPELPGNVIVVHGVNDVGVSFEQVEKGLCAGLNERLGWGATAPLRAASYRMPTLEDAGRLEPDPDAVFFKRSAAADVHSPVIPFYWGYRPAKGDYKSYKSTPHGQAVDRWGNRLDKDYSKGGGPSPTPPARCRTCGTAASACRLSTWWSGPAPTRCAPCLMRRAACTWSSPPSAWRRW